MVRCQEKTLGRQIGTELGGQQGRFGTTRWTLIISSQTSEEDRKKAILDELFQKYWKPVYWFIRRMEPNNEKAKDLTQGFFAEIVWGRDLIQSADPKKGRFRDFLKNALKHYLTDSWRHDHSKARMPSKEIFSIDAAEGFEPADADSLEKPEEVFNNVWLMEILQRSLAEVQTAMQEDGMDSYWTLFELRCLDPILKTSKPPGLKDVCKTLNIRDLAKASNMIVTVKRRVKKAIIRNLEKTIGSESELKDEIVTLIEKLSI
jgi:RNA polymerase sigma-70 factor (ECF subfamily)